MKLIPATLALFTLSFAFTIHAAEAPPPVTITELLKKAHPEAADKEVLIKRIELQPGVAAPPHVHPGMVAGYIESGTLEFQLKDSPLQVLKTGDTFFEPPGSHHMVGRNPDAKEKTVIIAFVINPKDAPLSTPLEQHKAPK